jgi:hypothetical protein
MEEWEHLCGDKAYVGISSIICPLKLKRDRWLTEGEARANKFLQLVRSPSRAGAVGDGKGIAAAFPAPVSSSESSSSLRVIFCKLVTFNHNGGARGTVCHCLTGAR